MPSTPYRHIGDQAEEEPQPLTLGRSLITVIGIDEYTHLPELTNAVNDAQAVLKLFKRCGFEELPGAPSLFNEQVTPSALMSLVRDQLPSELQPDDSLVLFYAGHGATVSREVPDPDDASKMTTRRTGYLVPPTARDHRPGEWLRLDAFLEDIADLPARHVLVILDACESGLALRDEFRGRSSGQASGTIADLAGRVSRRVMTSAMHDQKAMDGGGSGNSLFTETLIDAVENLKADHDGDGFITTTDLFSYVRQQVSDTASEDYHKKQTPDYGDLPNDGRGELVLSLRGDTYNRLRAEETLRVADQIYQLGSLSGDTRRFSSAARNYRAAHELATLGKMRLPAAKLGLGKALLATDQAAGAASVLTDLLKEEGETSPAEVHFYLGLAQAKRGEFRLAAEALRAWQERNPESLDAAWVKAYVDWLDRAAQPAAGRREALLVGINEYGLKQASQLRGCVNDVEKLMQPALLAQAGWNRDFLTVLTDAGATRARFVQEMQKLQSTTPADAVMVHFSGHAVPANRPDAFGKNDVENVYLLLHDTNDEPGYLTNGITADELHQLMQEIPAGRKTLILDTHASEQLMELARREGSYALIMASDTAEIAYEWSIEIAGERVRCGMLTGALYLSLLDADHQTLSYVDWLSSTIRIAEQASSKPPYEALQTPYFDGIKDQLVFGPNDIYLSAFEFSQRRDWPELSLSELTKLHAVFSRTITVPHPHGHAAFGRAFLSKGALGPAIAALQTAVEEAGDASPEHLLPLVRAQFQAGQYDQALAALQRLVPLAGPADSPLVKELDGSLRELVASQKHALLIGIDQYQSPEVPRLQGARNDVLAIKQLLTQRWGFRADDIVELTDAQATREAILTEFERLVGFAPGEPAFLFFAGIGSLEQSGRPTIVPYDGRQADVCDILLEQLADLAGTDAANLVVVLDTGFWSRQPETSDRILAPDDRGLTDYARFASYDEWSAYIDKLRIGAMTILPRVKIL